MRPGHHVLNIHVYCCYHWLIDCLIDWLIDWLVDCLLDWLIWLIWLVGWLVDGLVGCLLGWLVGLLVGWLIDWLIDWLLSFSLSHYYHYHHHQVVILIIAFNYISVFWSVLVLIDDYYCHYPSASNHPSSIWLWLLLFICVIDGWSFSMVDWLFNITVSILILISY